MPDYISSNLKLLKYKFSRLFAFLIIIFCFINFMIMNSTTPYSFTESYSNNWQKCFDSDFDYFYYRNEETNENTWSAPKKVKPSYDEYIPVENFISTSKANDSSLSVNHLVALSTAFNLATKCNMCGTEDNVKKHGYCQMCYDIINSPENPLIATYQIRCLGCKAYGLNLVQDDGLCSHCHFSLENNLPIKVYEDHENFLQLSGNKRDDPIFKRCEGCGGWGKDLVKENGRCDYCSRLEETKKFEARWKRRCIKCGGCGLDLVKEDGLCNHCRRQFAHERVFFSQVLNQRIASVDMPVAREINPKWVSMDDPVLGKRVREQDDYFEF